MSKPDSSKHLLGTPAVFLQDTSPQEGTILAVYKGKVLAAPSGKILYEPEIKALLGIPQTESVTCLYEKTCGAVVYTEQNSIRKFLLIKNESGHVGFPKGHIELNETEIETACREVFEETGLEISGTLLPDFRAEYSYVTLENTRKNCVYFLAYYEYQPAKIQESEVLQSWLVPYDEAMKLLNFPQDREILEKAQERLTT